LRVASWEVTKLQRSGYSRYRVLEYENTTATATGKLTKSRKYRCCIDPNNPVVLAAVATKMSLPPILCAGSKIRVRKRS
jgi:hypothetical protein